MRYILFIFALIFFTISCASSEKYDQKVRSFVGKSQAQLLAEWGTPSASKILNNGETVLTYTFANDIYIPNEYYTYNEFSQNSDFLYSPFDSTYDFSPFSDAFGQVVTEYCQTSFYLKNQRIIGFKYIGNNCVTNY